MSTLDIILLVCFIPAIVQGFRKGIIGQVTSLISLVAGVWLAFHFSKTLAATLAPSFQNVDEKVLQASCFIALALVAFIVLKLLCNLISKIVSDLSLGWFNRLLGVFFSIFTSALVIGLLINVFESFNGKTGLVQTDVTENSAVYMAIRDFTSKVFPFLKTLITNG